jgi:hypothetical protein
MPENREACLLAVQMVNKPRRVSSSLVNHSTSTSL